MPDVFSRALGTGSESKPVLKKESPIIRRSTFSVERRSCSCVSAIRSLKASMRLSIYRSPGENKGSRSSTGINFLPRVLFFPIPKKNSETHTAESKRTTKILELEVDELIVRKSPQKGDNKYKTRKADSMDGDGESHNEAAKFFGRDAGIGDK